MNPTMCVLVALVLGVYLTVPVVAKSCMESLVQEVNTRPRYIEYTISSAAENQPLLFENVMHTVTQAVLHALSQDKAATIAPQSFGSWWHSPSAQHCVDKDTCIFSSLVAEGSTALHSRQQHTWTHLAQTEFYLNGAGLLWIWGKEWLAEGSGCWATSVILSYIMRPSPKLQGLLNSLHFDTTKYICCADSADGCSTVVRSNQNLHGYEPLVMGGDCSAPSSLCQHLGLGAHSPATQQAVQYHVCSSSNMMIGYPSDLRVKITMLLSFARLGKNWEKWPTLYNSAGSTVWEDAWGFAACTSEELFREVHAARITGHRHRRWAVAVVARVSRKRPNECRDLSHCDCGPRPPPHALEAPVRINQTILPDQTINPTNPINQMNAIDHTNSIKPIKPIPSFNTCPLHSVLNQTARSYRGPLCCGYGRSTGLTHIQNHPGLQACRILVYTYIGDGKDLLRQPEAFSTSQDIPGICYIAIMDPVTARMHNISSTPTGLIRFGVWTVAILVNNPYWNRSDAHWSPRRQAKLMKFTTFVYFQNAQYSLWVDGKHSLKWPPQVVLGWLQGDISLAMFAHPDRNCAYDELYLEQHANLHRRTKDHKKSLKILESLYVEYEFPRQWGLPDSAVLVKKNTAEMRRADCLTWNLLHHAADRDQITLMFMLHRLGWKEGTHFKMLPRGCVYQVAPYFGHGIKGV